MMYKYLYLALLFATLSCSETTSENNTAGEFTYAKEYDPFIDIDSKDMAQITINGESHYMVVSNNAPLEIFRLAP